MSKICDICCEACEEFSLECCGLKYCFVCSHKTYSLCHVCEKDQINGQRQCDMCGNIGNGFTVQFCTKETCSMEVCDDCNKAGDTVDGKTKPFKYCSYLHFQEMLDELQSEDEEQREN